MSQVFPLYTCFYIMQQLLTDTTLLRVCLLRNESSFTKKIADIGKMSFEQNLSISCLF